MKKTIFTAICLAWGLIAASPLQAKERTVTLRVSGMTCGTCPISVRHRAMQMKGVHAATADLNTASATVTFDDREQSAQAIAQAITQLGYPATITDKQP